MAGVSKITIVGNLGKDPQTNYTPNGKMNVAFSAAVTHRRSDGSGGYTESTDWFNVKAWGRLAETLDRLTQQGALTKGKQVFVAGSFESRAYQANDGTQRTSLDVNADEVLLLGSRDAVDAPAGGTFDDVPF